MLLVAQAIDIRMAWMIKNDWLRGPAGMVLRRMGAVGIDRSRRTNLVQQMVDEFARHDDFVLVIPPEGTRSRAEHWKSGFYNIAVGAGVPVVPGFMDYGRKRVGLGAPIAMTGDVRVDMDAIRHFYDDKDPIGFHPELVGPIALRAETDSSAE